MISGTLAAFKWTQAAATVDGTGRSAGTSSVVQIVLSGNTPYGGATIPLAVNGASTR